eukprot:866412_1
MRGAGFPNATLVDGTWGGADWMNVWETFVSATMIEVMDTLGPKGSFLAPGSNEPAGFLPRPCIMGNFNVANNCGWTLGVDIDSLNVSSFDAQTLYYAFLPGLPPNSNCSLQGCPGHPCNVHPVCEPY